MPYLIDSDVLIRAKNDHYRFKVCPGFWDWLLQANQAGAVFSIARVQSELTAGKDPLSTWAAAQPASLFLAPPPSFGAAAASVSNWATSRTYDPQAVNTFFASADYWLVAHALAEGWTVVTHEVSRPDSKKSIKLPDACIGVGVAWTSPWQMLDDEGAVFRL
jgi:hypothetical protein